MKLKLKQEMQKHPNANHKNTHFCCFGGLSVLQVSTKQINDHFIYERGKVSN